MAKAVVVTAPPTKEARRYEIEEAMRVISRAEELRKDEKLMREVRLRHEELKKALGREPRRDERKRVVEKKR